MYTTYLSQSHQARFDSFSRNYRHNSRNPAFFELLCFKRYYSMLSNIGDNENLIMMDSDVLISANFLDFSFLEDLIGEQFFIGSVGVNNGILEDQISPHFTVWNKSRIYDFCEYLDNYYSEKNTERLELDRRHHVAGQINVSDMTLLARWVLDRDLIIQNTNQIIDGKHLDHNISLSECEGNRFQMEFSQKKIRHHNHIELSTESGESVRPVTLHFPGRYKKLIRSTQSRSRAQFIGVAAMLSLSKMIK